MTRSPEVEIPPPDLKFLRQLAKWFRGERWEPAHAVHRLESLADTLERALRMFEERQELGPMEGRMEEIYELLRGALTPENPTDQKT